MDLVSNFPPILNFINKDLEIQDKTKQNPLPCEVLLIDLTRSHKASESNAKTAKCTILAF